MARSMQALANMQQNNPIFPAPPQYIPPKPISSNQVNIPSNQISPPTKRQQKIAKAKFPAARAWWEDVKEGIGGPREQFQQFSTITPQQQSVLDYLQRLGVYGLQNPNAGFAPIAQQATNQFYQQTVPTLAERFTSVGNGALSSPAFASQLGQAGAGLQSDLAAQQAQFGQQNIQQLLQMLQLGLNPYTENIHRPAQSGLAGKGIEAFIKALPGLFS